MIDYNTRICVYFYSIAPVIGCTFGIQVKRILPTIQAALNKARVVILLIGKRELEVGNTRKTPLF